MKKNPKVALVHDFLYTFAGAERVLLSLHELYPDAPIYTALAEPELVKAHFPKADIRVSSLQKKKGWIRKIPPLLMLSMPLAVESWDFSGYDIVISSSGAYCHNILTGPGTVHISYCHTPVRFAWDWHREYLRERGTDGGLKLYVAEMMLSYLRSWDAAGADRADYYLANSSAVAARIATYYRRASRLVYPPVNTEFFDYEQAESRGEAGPYAVSVSRLSPTKRVDMIIEACGKAGLPLWIGGSGDDRSRLESLAARQKTPVRFLGAISETEKRDILAGASCFLFATEEDFGIAPVEALAVGTPVLAYGKGGALETVTDGKSGLFFDELTADSLAACLSRFLKKGVAWDREAIRRSALQFSDKRFKEEIRRFVEEHA